MRRHMGLLGLVTIMLAAGSVGCGGGGGGGGGNKAPVARAGSDQTVLVSTAVTLDGSASSDADGDPITFQWSFVSKPGGSAATLSGATAEKPTMTPDVGGSYVIQLVVNDGTIDSAADQVTVTATAEALPAPGEGIAALAAVQTIFNRSCAVAGCHVLGGSAPMSLQTADSYKSLFGQPAFTAAGTRVIPLDGADSVLYKKVSGTSAGARMPLGQAPLSTADQELIKKWIDQGASRAGRLGAVLRGEQVEPAKVTTSARGTGTVTLDADQTEIGFTLTLSPLPASPIILAHIHLGDLGQSGGILFDLLGGASFTSPLSGVLRASEFNPVGTVTTFAQAVDALLRGKTYFQVHTQDNPGGEVRGQIGPASLSATLSGANEVSPVTTSGTGSGSFTVNSDQDALAFSVTFTGLGSATTGSHIHKGNPGENGPVIFPLASGSFASPITGLLTSANANPGTDDQFLEDVDDILSGETYVNVHTVNNGDGEIRGQIQP